MRVVAGPNGSGKSTLKTVIPEGRLGVYVNADDIQAQLVATGHVDLARYRLGGSSGKLRAYLKESPQFQLGGAESATSMGIAIEGDRIVVNPSYANPYLSAALADFIRHELLRHGESFTFETVMSHGSKIDFMRHARTMGYRVYLYYVATQDPEINCSRIALRVQDGGHDVPEEKVRERYVRSLALLPAAIKAANRAYIFDNSTEHHAWIAEGTDGEMVLRVESVPPWFYNAVMSVAGIE